MNAGGMKFDDGKLRVDLIPPEARRALAEVLTFGAKKYEENSWRTVPDAIKRYKAARERHLLAIDEGETHDAESGLPHSWHALCNEAFIVALEGGQKKQSLLAEDHEPDVWMLEWDKQGENSPVKSCATCEHAAVVGTFQPCKDCFGHRKWTPAEGCPAPRSCDACAKVRQPRCKPNNVNGDCPYFTPRDAE